MKDRNFWLYAMGRFVTILGLGMTNVAGPLFILDLTGSGKIMGTFIITAMMPALLLYPVAGVIGDRFNRKTIMVSMDFGRGALCLFLAFLAARNYLTIPLFLVLVFAGGIMGTFFGPATAAMLPDIVKEKDLTRANSIMRSLYSFSSIIGPTLGGIVYAFGGVKLSFLITGISLIGSGASELFIQYHQKTKKLEHIKEVVTDLKEGISFIKIHRGLLTFLVFALLSNFFLSPVGGVLIPYVFRVVIEFSSEQYGMLQTSFVVGALIGNIIIGTILAKAQIGTMLKRGLIGEQVFNLMFAVLIFPLVIVYLGYASWVMFSVIFVVSIFRGLANSFVNVPISVGLQKLVPTEYRARVFSVMEVISMGIMPIGVGVVGIFLDMAPAYVIAFAMFLTNFFVVIIFIFRYLSKVMKEFEHEEAEQEEFEHEESE
jgi:DHA3 family macrolide efflux protein-like MFS transporter